LPDNPAVAKLANVVRVNMHEARTRLSELVRAVEERNETVVVCRDGVEVAGIRRRPMMGVLPRSAGSRTHGRVPRRDDPPVGHPSVTVTMYGIRNCDTMKKARAWLDAHAIAYAFHDYAVSGIGRAQLAEWAADVGWERLCNRAGTTFRKLPDADTRDLTEGKALDLMVAQPSMIKRPVLTISSGGRERILVGFSPDAYAEALAERR
jgi:arsenate reductase